MGLFARQLNNRGSHVEGPTNTMSERFRPPSREELEASLAQSRARLADLEQRGNDACSAYDLRMGYDATFNKKLVSNHVKYYERLLEPYRTQPQQSDFLSMFDVGEVVPQAEETSEGAPGV